MRLRIKRHSTKKQFVDASTYLDNKETRGFLTSNFDVGQNKSDAIVLCREETKKQTH